MEATCEYCGRKMVKGGGCRRDAYIIKGKRVKRIPNIEDTPCHDCGAGFGKQHHPGCDDERCPICGGQAIGCECLDGCALDLYKK